MSREAVLRAIGTGRTTAEVSQQLAVSPSQASARLNALKLAGDVEQVMVEKRRLIWRRR